MFNYTRVRATPAVGAPQGTRRIKKYTSWGAKTLRRRKNVVCFPAVAHPKQRKGRHEEREKKNLTTWRKAIGRCFRRRPQAEPSPLGLAWVRRRLPDAFLSSWGGYGDMAGRVFDLFTNPASKKVLWGSCWGAGWSCSKATDRAGTPRPSC